MCRIEPIVEHFYAFAIKSVFSVIKPDRDNCQERKTLAQNFDFRSENFPFVIKTGNNFGIYVPKADKLKNKILKTSSPEKIENQNCKNSRIMIIAKSKSS